MRRFLRLFLLLGVFSVPTFCGAATSVEPVLSGALTWVRDQSPYLLQKDTRLIPGASLVIYPGVVIEVSTEQDSSVPQGSPNVDFIIQGDLQILGNNMAPVSLVSARPPYPWGVFYVLPSSPQNWSQLTLSGGQLILARGTLKMTQCSVIQGKGIGLGAGADLQLVECQVDENESGLSFLDPSSSATLSKTRFRQNAIGLAFRTGGVLRASESSVYGSSKYNAANFTAGGVDLPSLWWGTVQADEIRHKILDGRVQNGTGLFQLATPLPTDPMMKALKGFDPGQDPKKRFRTGPRFIVGPLFQTVQPDLNIPLAELKMTLGYGAQAGVVVGRDLEMRGVFQSVSFSATNVEKKSSLRLTFLRMGMKAHKSLALSRARRLFLFGEAGGLVNLSKEDLIRPEDPLEVTTPLITKRITETNLDMTFCAGLEFQIGRHKVEVGAFYESTSLNDNRGGSFTGVQGAFDFYF